jgi:MoxR-like ATPase
MGRKHQGAGRQEKTLQVWSYEQAKAASPYLASILRSVRERQLESVRSHQTAKRLAAAPGRPDRKAIIALEDARRDAQQADERLHDALQELLDMDVYSLDPVQGLALIPFVQGEQLAWFVYDLFDRDPLRFWRYHTDALETRRPIAEISEEPQNQYMV